MTSAQIHPHGGPKKLTIQQQQVADELVERDIYVYTEKVTGRGIVSAWRRYLERGDAEQITDPLYEFIHGKCGYIAHFNLHNFRLVYADPAKMLEGEMYANVWREGGSGGPVQHSASVYTDGWTDQEVHSQMVEVAESLREQVIARSTEATAKTELQRARDLAAKHGYSLERNLDV